MLNETLATFAIPLAIYCVMGIVITRIELDKTSVKGFNFLKWTQFIVDVLRIVFMWPLVLFIDKSKSWLEKTAGVAETESGLIE